MSWMLLATLAAFLWAVANIIDKVSISKLTHEPAVPVILQNCVGVIVAIWIFGVRGIPLTSLGVIPEIIVFSIFALLPSYCYLAAAKEEEISRIIPLFQISNLFTAVIAAVVLQEVLSVRTYGSIVIILIGALMISSRRLSPLTFSKGVWWMVAAAFTYAVYAIFLKHLLRSYNFWDVFAMMRLVEWILILPLIGVYRQSLGQLIRNHGGRGITLISANQLVSMAGVLAHVVASSLGPITLVNAITSIQPVFVLLLSIMATSLIPSMFKEVVNPKTLVRKFVAISLIIVGSWGIV